MRQWPNTNMVIKWMSWSSPFHINIVIKPILSYWIFPWWAENAPGKNQDISHDIQQNICVEGSKIQTLYLRQGVFAERGPLACNDLPKFCDDILIFRQSC